MLKIPVDANVPDFKTARATMLDARDNLRRASQLPLAADALAHLLGALDMLELAERALVAAAREQGSTWEQLGDVLGVTRQAAPQRFGGGAE